jgi:hypothetical protein
VARWSRPRSSACRHHHRGAARPAGLRRRTAGTSLASDAVALQLPVVAAAVVYATVLVGHGDGSRLRPMGAHSDADAPQPADAAPRRHRRARSPIAALITPRSSARDVSRRGFIGRSRWSSAAPLRRLLPVAPFAGHRRRPEGGGSITEPRPGGFGRPHRLRCPTSTPSTRTSGRPWSTVRPGHWPSMAWWTDHQHRPGRAAVAALPGGLSHAGVHLDRHRPRRPPDRQPEVARRAGHGPARSGVSPVRSWILWQADDGFAESLPLEAARHPDTWIAYLMGDQPLTPGHGTRARPHPRPLRLKPAEVGPRDAARRP